MVNLKNETLYVLHKHGKKKADVRWVGCEDFKIPLEDFWRQADEEYDNSYGCTEVAQNLLVCGDDWWMERHEYDGSEWWEFKEQPKEPERIGKGSAFCLAGGIN